jgi:N-methylhydantoinase A/acetone carboxylase, beta subunit
MLTNTPRPRASAGSSSRAPPRCIPLRHGQRRSAPVLHQAFGQHAPARFRKASDHVSAEALSGVFAALDQRCREALGDKVQIKRLAGMRFRQQVHQIEVEIPNRDLTPADVDAAVDRFEERYESIYGRGTALRNSGVEFITVRVEGTRPLAIPAMTADTIATGPATPVATRRVYFYREGFHDLPVYRWTDLAVGTRIEGPAIVERPDTTIVIGLTQRAEIEPLGNMIIERKTGAGDAK